MIGCPPCSWPCLCWSGLIDAIVATEPTWRARFGQLAPPVGFFGFTYFVQASGGLVSLSWRRSAAFVTGGEHFIWLMPLGVVGLPIILALFTAFGVMLAGLLWSRGAWRIAALTVGLGASEWLRSWLFTGFPWNSWGRLLASHLVLSQGVALIGASGMGLWLVFVAASPATLGNRQTRLGRWGMPVFRGDADGRCAWLWLFQAQPHGRARGRFHPPAAGAGYPPQGDATQHRAGCENLRVAGPGFAAALSRAQRRRAGAHATGIANVTHLFWPESPFPFVLERNAEAIAAIGRFLPAQTHLITGAIRAEETGEARPRFRYFNAMQVLDKTGIVAGYDKVHLVPFGEYLPFESVLRAMGLSISFP